jgi:hypothetical protein
MVLDLAERLSDVALNFIAGSNEATSPCAGSISTTVGRRAILGCPGAGIDLDGWVLRAPKGWVALDATRRDVRRQLSPALLGITGPYEARLLLQEIHREDASGPGQAVVSTTPYYVENRVVRAIDAAASEWAGEFAVTRDRVVSGPVELERLLVRSPRRETSMAIFEGGIRGVWAGHGPGGALVVQAQIPNFGASDEALLNELFGVPSATSELNTDPVDAISGGARSLAGNDRPAVSIPSRSEQTEKLVRVLTGLDEAHLMAISSQYRSGDDDKRQAARISANAAASDLGLAGELDRSRDAILHWSFANGSRSGAYAFASIPGEVLLADLRGQAAPALLDAALALLLDGSLDVSAAETLLEPWDAVMGGTRPTR